MKSGAFHRTLLVIATALMAACADSPRSVPTAPSFAVVKLGTCSELTASGELTFHAYASGVQIYRWNGASWVFVAPRATLYADANGRAVVGSHYAGPTWESVSGSTVVGAVAKRCTPNATAIPWLLLDATSSTGPGVLQGVTQIQRVNTVGGVAPLAPGSILGDIAEVPYAAEYFFYRGRE
jgi:FtsP/CotA-like multicopper oxidase with cupredoxin domain